jgi:hypothetical protein
MNTQTLIAQVDSALRQPDVKTAINLALTQARSNLDQSDDEWQSVAVPIHVYGNSLPDAIQSSRVVVFRASAAGRYERHPNSTQFVCVLAGTVDIQTLTDNQWHSNLKGADSTELADRWSYVPQGVWHHPVVSDDSDCEIVAFHTVPADQLIDEHGTADTLA